MRKTFFALALALAAAGHAQDTDYSAQVRSDILPWVQSVGQLFGLSAEGLDSLRWSDAYLTSCGRGGYLRRARKVITAR